jgi:large subunit ribosomal protein L30
MLKITLTKGLIGKREDHRKVVKALGLGKFGSSVVHEDSPTIRGMVNKIHHLVTVCQEGEAKAPSKKAAAPKAAAKPQAEKAAAKKPAKKEAE